jgi:outer membrane protein TolC
MRSGIFRFELTLVFFFLLGSIYKVQAADLLSSFRDASQNDVQWLAAVSKYQQSAEFKSLAAARLLPNLSFTQTKNSVKQDTFNSGVIDLSRSGTYPSSTKVLALRQPIIRAQEVVGLQVANAQTMRAYHAFKDEEQQLALRVVYNYLDAIHSQVSLNSAKVFLNLGADEFALVQAKVKSGLLSPLDEASAKANFEKYKARELQAQEYVALSLNQLLMQTGASPGENLKKIDTFDAQFIKLPPLESLIIKAVEAAPKVLLASMETEIARAALLQAQAAHLPTLDFVGQVARNLSDSPYNQGAQTNIRAVGAQLTVPLYSGGGTNSQIRSAAKEYEQAELRSRDVINKTKLQVQSEFNLIKSGLLVVGAYQAAFDAADISANSRKLGASIGFQSEVDRLRALSDKEQAQMSLHQAKVDVIKSWFRLHAILGEIDENMLEVVNAFLR